MTRSITIWIIVSILLIYGSYNSWLIYQTGESLFGLWVSACFIASIGLIFNKSWSQYFVYLISLFTTGGWAYFIIYLATTNWPYTEVRDTFIALVPGILFISIPLLSSIYVFKYFKRMKQLT